MDTSAVGDPVGLISGINMIELPADTKIADELRIAQPPTSTTASAWSFWATSSSTRLSAANGSSPPSRPPPLKMEAAAITTVCFVNKIPFAAIRVISDEASGDVKIDYMTFVKAAAATSDIALGGCAPAPDQGRSPTLKGMPKK